MRWWMTSRESPVTAIIGAEISGADLALLYDTEVYLQERGLPGGAGAGAPQPARTSSGT